MCARPKVVQFVSFWHEWDWTGKIKLKFQHNCIWHENNENFIQKNTKKKNYKYLSSFTSEQVYERRKYIYAQLLSTETIK